jgi:hypothetical protein
MLISTCMQSLALQRRKIALRRNQNQQKCARLMNIRVQRGVWTALTGSTMRTVSIAIVPTVLYADRTISGCPSQILVKGLELQQKLKTKISLTPVNACTTHVAGATAKTMITFNAKLCHHLWHLIVLDAQLIMEKLNVRFACQATSSQETNSTALK